MASDTPRTDAILRDAPRHPISPPGQHVLITPAPQLLDLARQLERELSAALDAVRDAHEIAGADLADDEYQMALHTWKGKHSTIIALSRSHEQKQR